MDSADPPIPSAKGPWNTATKKLFDALKALHSTFGAIFLLVLLVALGAYGPVVIVFAALVLLLGIGLLYSAERIHCDGEAERERARREEQRNRRNRRGRSRNRDDEGNREDRSRDRDRHMSCHRSRHRSRDGGHHKSHSRSRSRIRDRSYNRDSHNRVEDSQERQAQLPRPWGPGPERPAMNAGYDNPYGYANPYNWEGWARPGQATPAPQRYRQGPRYANPLGQINAWGGANRLAWGAPRRALHDRERLFPDQRYPNQSGWYGGA